MKWFEGSVTTAITESKSASALFVVYVESDVTEDNSSMNTLWDGVNIEDFPVPVVAIKLSANTDDARNFAAIYPTPTLPISYFIGLNGRPLEIITKVKPLTADQFVGTIQKTCQAFTAGAAPAASPSAPVTAPSSSSGDAAHAEAEKERAIAEKIKKAKELLAAKKAAEEEQKRREEIAKETERRESAKEMQRLAEERRNKELLQAAAERRKEKLENEKEKERVKERIKADKAEREARFARQNATTAPTESVQPKTIPSPVIASDRCRIQVRFPDGSSALHDFPSGDTLASLRHIVSTDARVRGSSFRLAQPAPRRIYKDEDYDQSLLSLGLTPASTLLVLVDQSTVTRVVASTTSQVSTTTSSLSALVGWLALLVWSPIRYVLSLVGIGGGTATTGNAAPPAPSSRSQTTSGVGDSSVRKRHVTTENRGSNIRTLNSGTGDEAAEKKRRDSEDDKDANWNGNSTQFL